MIADLVENWIFLNRILIPAYKTETGKRIYEQSLHLCNQKFRKYVEELEGMAEGSNQPFYKVNYNKWVVECCS